MSLGAVPSGGNTHEGASAQMAAVKLLVFFIFLQKLWKFLCHRSIYIMEHSLTETAEECFLREV